MRTVKDLVLRKVNYPNPGLPARSYALPNEVYEARLDRLIERMKASALDAMVFYADREHYHNFKHYAGFDPRFEEALLIIHSNRRLFAALGNECLSLLVNSRLPVTGVLCQIFSLPNQPLDKYVSMEQVLRDCGLKKGTRTGVVDWKLISDKKISALPAFIYNAICNVCEDQALVTNETSMMIDPATGLRVNHCADDIAYLEYGAALASQAVIDMNDSLRPGMTEKEVASVVKYTGIPQNCHMMVCSGDNVAKGLISPTDRVIGLGDEINLVYSIEGGLACRHAVVAKDEKDLTYDAGYFIEEVVKPYLATVFNWYEMMHIGVRGSEIYNMVQSSLPKEKYGWYLNPGHLGGTEEWMSSPIYSGSGAVITSGMLMQMDIIPVMPGYCSPNNEDGIIIAGEQLRDELKQKHPEVYARIMVRRRFMKEELGLELSPEVMPLSNLAGAYSPYLLSKDLVITVM